MLIGKNFSKIQLNQSEIHLWLIPLVQTNENIAEFSDYLDETERKKADGFRFEFLRKNYLVSHYAMREILSFYLNVLPKNIRFSVNSFGKPFVKTTDETVYFNLSHSGKWCVLGICKSGEIGIDIEEIRLDFDEEEISKRFFSSFECELLDSVEDAFRQKAFFKIWTKKEAFVKAIGKGLTIPLQNFTVLGDAFTKSGSFKIEENLYIYEDWHFFDLEIGKNYACAFVTQIENPDWKQFLWTYSKNT